MQILKTMEWHSLTDAFSAIVERLAANDGGKFILDNWNCKYIDVRIDMRTGNTYIQPGNVQRRVPTPPDAGVVK